MNVKTFFKDKLVFILIQTGVIAFVITLLTALRLDTYAICFIAVLWVLADIAVLLAEFFRKQGFYNRLKSILCNLDKKYLLSELIEEPDFAEGQILHEIIRLTNKSMNDEILKYKISSQEYREYIETWVHEIKTPIASSKLIILNNKNDITINIEEEINKIDAFVEQALYYSRSNSVEKDYSIKKVALADLVNSVIRRNSKDLIESKTEVDLTVGDISVFTDTKWTQFILNQLIGNAIKYKRNNLKLKITSKLDANSVCLFIEDNGIGIPGADIERVFEKGFTGENGRKYAKSTGMGLYLCKKLCDKLALNISITSVEGRGTTVAVTFPMNTMLQFEP